MLLSQSFLALDTHPSFYKSELLVCVYVLSCFIIIIK